MTTIFDEFNKAFDDKQWEEVVRLKDKVLSILQRTNSKSGEAVYFVNLGIAYRHLHDMNKSIECQEVALDIYNSLDNLNGTGYCFTNLGIAFQELGMLKQSIAFHEKAIAIAIQTSDKNLELISKNNKNHVEYAIKRNTLVIIDGDQEIRFTSDIDRFLPRKKSESFIPDYHPTNKDLSEKNKVFISYSHRDKALVTPLVGALTEQGFSVYFDTQDRPDRDVHSLRLGLSEGITESYAMLVCFSENYSKSSWCQAEMRGFIQSNIKESGLSKLPLLVLDIDGKVSNEKLIGICLRIEMMNKNPQAEEFTKSIIEAIQNIRKIPYSNSNSKDQFGHIIDQLSQIRKVFIQGNNALVPTFSRSEDFDLIWEDAFRNIDISRAGITEEEIIEALVSKIPDTEHSSSFRNALSIWDYIWNFYKSDTIAKYVDINEILEEFSPPSHFETPLQEKIKKYSDPNLFELFEGIAKNSDQNIAMFDRSSSESTRFYHNWSKDISSGNKNIERRTLRGQPLHLLLGESQRRALLMPLQYTYYHYLKERTNNHLVTVSVFASLLINIDMWFEVLTAKEEFMDLIVKPLSTGKDIRSIFP